MTEKNITKLMLIAYAGVVISYGILFYVKYKAKH